LILADSRTASLRPASLLSFVDPLATACATTRETGPGDLPKQLSVPHGLVRARHQSVSSLAPHQIQGGQPIARLSTQSSEDDGHPDGTFAPTEHPQALDRSRRYPICVSRRNAPPADFRALLHRRVRDADRRCRTTDARSFHGLMSPSRSNDFSLRHVVSRVARSRDLLHRQAEACRVRSRLSKMASTAVASCRPSGVCDVKDQHRPGGRALPRENTEPSMIAHRWIRMPFRRSDHIQAFFIFNNTSFSWKYDFSYFNVVTFPIHVSTQSIFCLLINVGRDARPKATFASPAPKGRTSVSSARGERSDPDRRWVEPTRPIRTSLLPPEPT
jgi:hypothetical protein